MSVSPKALSMTVSGWSGLRFTHCRSGVSASHVNSASEASSSFACPPQPGLSSSSGMRSAFME